MRFNRMQKYPLKCLGYLTLTLISISANIHAKPYIGGTFQDDIGKYDSPAIKVIVDEASKVCLKMFKGDFIIDHWVYKPDQGEVYLTGRTHGWLFTKQADCSYRPSNKSAEGSKYPDANIMGVYESFKTDNGSH